MDLIYPSQPIKLKRIDSSIVSELSKSGEWIAEPKYNGSRCIIVTDETGNPIFYGRDGNRLCRCNYDFKLNPNSVYDSEWMQTRMKGEEFKNQFWVFDILFKDGIEVALPLSERKKVLEQDKFLKTVDFCHLMPYIIGTEPDTFKKLYDKYIERLELEGVILKKLSQLPIYHRLNQPDNPMWVKIRQPDMFYRQKNQQI